MDNVFSSCHLMDEIEVLTDLYREEAYLPIL